MVDSYDKMQVKIPYLECLELKHESSSGNVVGHNLADTHLHNINEWYLFLSLLSSFDAMPEELHVVQCVCFLGSIDK